MIVRVTVRAMGLQPGDEVEVDPRTKRIKQLLAAGVLVPVKKQT
jgi:hypothetical protein